MVDKKKLEELVISVLDRHNVSLYSLNYKDAHLEVLIDSKDGIDLDKCIEVSEDLSKELDKKDPIKEEYCLEVASSGAEKPLVSKEDYVNNLDKFVLVQVASKVEGYDELVGFIREVKESSIILEIKIKTRIKKVEIALSNITYAISTVNI